MTGALAGNKSAHEMPRSKLTPKIFKKSKLRSKLKVTFRSGSDADKTSSSISLSGNDPAPKPQFSTENDTKDQACSPPRPHPGDSVWVTSASHPHPFSGGQAHSLPGFLAHLSLQSTPVTSGAVGPKAETSGQAKSHLPGTAALTAQELHDSVLSALGGAMSVSSVQERKTSKKQPSGTFEYMIKDGDTLVKIAARFDVTPSELKKTNRLLSSTVFVGQTLFIPDPNYVPRETPSPKSVSPVPDSRPKVDIPLVSLADRPPAYVPGHVVQVSSWHKSQAEEEPDRECLQKFLKMPVRRVMEEEEDELLGSEGFTIKGTLLVTPNAIMFDPDVNDPVVVDHNGQTKFSMVVYMEEIKSVALFHDISPRMFWRQPKELRAHSPRPETYRTEKGKRAKVEGQAANLGPSSQTAADVAEARVCDAGEENKKETGRTSEELEAMTEITGQELAPQPGRTSEEVEHTLTQSLVYPPISPLIKQMSRSSELEVCEISAFQEAEDVFGETRDFGPHMGRSSSEVHRHASSSLGRISDASPGDPSGRSLFMERSDSTSDSLSTPTQGFAPLHFTDRSPKSVTAHPKPVPGQRALLLPQEPVPCINLKLQENRIVEDSESVHGELAGSGQFEVSSSTDDLFPLDASSADFSTIKTLSVTHAKLLGVDQHPVSVSEAGSSEGHHSGLTSKDDVDSDNLFPTQEAPSIQSSMARQFSQTSLGSADDLEEDTSKAPASPRSSFSPLRAPAQHISSFFNYTSSFFRSTGVDRDRSSSTPPPPASSDSPKGKSKVSNISPASSTSNIKLQLKSGFSKEDISRVLDKDPKNFLPRSDSCHFEESPLYLQIRPGIQRDKEIFQPRAFDPRDMAKLLEEYWFVVPRDMGDKLYNFLMEWQPDAYGDQEETEVRDKFFYDVREVEHRIQPLKKSRELLSVKAGGDGQSFALPTTDDHLNEDEKTWEVARAARVYGLDYPRKLPQSRPTSSTADLFILSKEEVYGAEKSQAFGRQTTFDESTFPELIGPPTQILEYDHIWQLAHVIPRTMTAGYNWELVYATHKHGYSLQNLYQKMEMYDSDEPVLLFIKDSKGCVFGAYLSNSIHPSDTFYGSGGTFLFTFYEQFKKYAWSGENQFFMNGTKDFFAAGSGTGLFGLWVDGDLNKGRSHRCATFNNEVLSKEEDFAIIDLEVWRFVDSSFV